MASLDGTQKTMGDLLAVMAALRTPDTGCPWDLVQTFATIAPYTIEEAYEVADAIARDDLVDLKEELGDLLLQVVYHARMAEECGAFDFGDVVDAVARKMIRRHPHVFGSEDDRARGAQPGFWERIKAEEREEKQAERAKLSRSEAANRSGAAENSDVPRVLGDIPVALPALTRAVKLQSKASRVGFDWSALGPIVAKLREELAELEEAIGEADRDQQEAEYGDLLFVIANLARHLRVDPEAALRRTNDKFLRRFERIEDWLAEDGRTPQQSNLEEMDRLWERAKAEERIARAGKTAS